MNDIDLKIISKRHREEICFDGGSWGIEFIFDTGEAEITKKEELRIKEIAIEQIRKITPFYQFYRMEPGENAGGSQAEGSTKKTVCFRVIAFLNDISGNRLVRDHIEKTYAIDLRKCRSTHLSKDNERNFVPIKARLDKSIGPNIGKIMQLEAPAMLFSLLESQRKLLQKTLRKALPDIEIASGRYLVGGIEINFDLMYRSGIDFAAHPEIGLRLSRSVCLPRTGVWVLKAKQSCILPSAAMRYHEFKLKRLFDRDFVFGVPCYYGEMADKTEMYVVCKERPQVPLSMPVNSSPNGDDKHSELATPLKYWLHRFEWRIKKNARMKNKEVREFVKEIGGKNSFTSESELRAILDKLYKLWFEFLSDNLNAPFQLTDELVQKRVRNLADCYHPKHSNQLGDALTRSGRVNRHAGFVNPVAIDRGEADGVFVRKRSHYNQDSGVNWDALQPDDPF